MPFYEYRCKNCGHSFEVLQRMSDDPITACENCGAEEAQRVLFAPAIHFKGSGFHNTDYGTKRRPVGGGGESDGGGTTTATADSGSGGDTSSGSSGKTVGLDQA